jgi:hypothetical protein
MREGAAAFSRVASSAVLERQEGSCVMDIIRDLPWLLSAITIWMTVMAGNKHKSAWLIGLINQALWLWWIQASGNWGLLPMNLALWGVYARNHIKWMKEASV